MQLPPFPSRWSLQSDLTSLGLGALSFMDIVRELPPTPHRGHGMSWEPGKEALKSTRHRESPGQQSSIWCGGDLPWARSCAGCSPSHQAWKRGCRVASMLPREQGVGRQDQGKPRRCSAVRAAGAVVLASGDTVYAARMQGEVWAQRPVLWGTEAWRTLGRTEQKEGRG